MKVAHHMTFDTFFCTDFCRRATEEALFVSYRENIDCCLQKYVNGYVKCVMKCFLGLIEFFLHLNKWFPIATSANSATAPVNA